MPGNMRRVIRGVAAGCVVVGVLVVLGAIASFPWVVELDAGDSWWTLQNGRVRIGWFYVPRNRRGVEGWHLNRNDAMEWNWPMQVPRMRLSGGPFGLVNVPLWLPVVVLAGVAGVAYHRSRGFGPGRCGTCGYD